MSWLYFFDDEDEYRIPVTHWLKEKMPLAIHSYSDLPAFGRWLATHGASLPDLLLLDLYQDKSPDRTIRFMRELRANPRTRQLPVVLLTMAGMGEEGSRAYDELDVDDFIPKLEILRYSGPDGAWKVRADMADAQQKRLLRQVAKGTERRRTTAVKERLRRLLRGRSFAVFEAQRPFRLLDGSDDVLTYLKKHLGTVPDAPAPAVLLPLLDGSSSQRQTLPGVEQRTVVADIDPDMEGSVVLNFRDLCSLPYLEAIGKIVFQRYFKPDHKQLIRRALETAKENESTAARRCVSDEEVETLIEAAKGNFLALACVTSPGLKLVSDDELKNTLLLKAEHLRDKAGLWQRANFHGYPDAYRRRLFPRDVSKIHAALHTHSAHLADASKMAGEMRGVLEMYPLLESTL